METNIRITTRVGIVFALCLSALSSHGQGTAFTYQGRLNDGSAPPNGVYDVRFTLYATNITGSPAAGPLTNSAIGVTNGLFTTAIDFGPGLFTGTNYWLDLAVRTNGAGAFTDLSPRQPLTPAPYAIMANSASNLLGVLPAGQLSGTISNTALPASPTFSGTVTGSSFVGNGSNLTNLNAANVSGVVTANHLPADTAYVDANQFFTGSNEFTQTVLISNSAPLLRLESVGGAGAVATLDLSTYNPGTNLPSARVQTSDDNWGSDWDFYSKKQGAGTNPLVSLLHLSADGNVGISTNNPLANLTVGGAISANNIMANSTITSSGSIGANGNINAGGKVTLDNGLNAAAASEALRIVRGTVNANAAITAGSGFTVTSNSPGNFTITLSPGFSGTPSVTATPSSINYFTAIGSAAATGFFVITFDKNDNAANVGFSFIAIGPE